MRPNKPSFNYGSNNINMINKQFGRRSDSKPRFQFNPRRFNPYPKQPRPMSTNSPRPLAKTYRNYLNHLGMSRSKQYVIGEELPHGF